MLCGIRQASCRVSGISIVLAAGVVFAASPAAADTKTAETVSHTNGLKAESCSTMCTFGWIAIGGGALALAGAGTFFYLAERKHAGIGDDARAGRTPDHADRELVDSYTVGGFMLMATGIAAAGAGATLLVLDNGGQSSSRGTQDAGVRVAIDPRGVVLTGTF